MTDRRTNYVINLSGNVEARSQAVARSVEQMSTRSNRAFDAMKRKTAEVGREMQKLGQGMQEHAGKVATATTAVAVWKAEQARKDSADLDKQLIRVRQTAGASVKEMHELRALLFSMDKDTGAGVNNLLDGFNNLVQSGNSWQEALAIIQAINPAMAVTGSQADTLASALGVAKANFDFDLSNLETAKTLLDQMTVAGRIGNAELEDLSSIFARIGQNAKRSNLSFETTLAFVEQLSLIERQPEKLGTLADSTLRVFTNGKYRAEAAKASGVKFYDADGSRRDPMAVIGDLSTKYQTLTTDKRRDKFIDDVFGKTDIDTQKGLQILLGGNNLQQIDSSVKQISEASGTIARDLPDAIANAVDQGARLKSVLRDAADGFSQPINKAITDLIDYGLSQDQNKEMPWQSAAIGGGAAAGGAAAVFGGAYLLNKVGGKVLEKVGGGLLGKFGGALNPGTGGFAGALGKMGAGGVPVVVTNTDAINSAVGWTQAPDVVPDSWAAKAAKYAKTVGGADMKTIAGGGAAMMGTAAAGVAVAGAAGYGAGTLLYNAIDETSFADSIGRGIAKAMSLVSQEARDALAREEAYKKSQVEVSVKVEAANGASAQVTGVKAEGAKADVGATQGHY